MELAMIRLWRAYVRISFPRESMFEVRHHFCDPRETLKRSKVGAEFLGRFRQQVARQWCTSVSYYVSFPNEEEERCTLVVLIAAGGPTKRRRPCNPYPPLGIPPWHHHQQPRLDAWSLFRRRPFWATGPWFNLSWHAYFVAGS